MGREAVHAKKPEWVNPIKRVTPLEKQSPNSKRAEAVLQHVISQVKNDVYGLSYGLSVFDLVAVKEKTKLASDGKHLFFQPAYVLSMRNMGKTAELKKQVIHLTLHGLLGHYEKDRIYQHQMLAWDVMDLQVTQLEKQLEPWQVMQSWKVGDPDSDDFLIEPEKHVNQEIEEQRWKRLEEVDCGYDMELYYRAKKNRDLAKMLKENRCYLYRDNHYLWHGENNYFSKKASQTEEDNEGKNSKNSGGTSKGGGVKKNTSKPGGKPQDSGGKKNTSKSGGKPQGDGAKKNESTSWEIAQKLLLQGNPNNLKCLSAALLNQGDKLIYGNEAGDAAQQVKKADIEGNDYKEVFREFFSDREITKEQVDTIDPMLYHYGLELYDNIPIIEPLEVMEQKAFHTIVIAVDTSGSCSGETAERFLKETCNMLEDVVTTGYIEKIYLMQCDVELQQVDKLDSMEDMKAFCENTDNWNMKGWGGTSFIPVFEKVDAMQEEGEIIDCLFYLSDGYGSYPEKESDYLAFMVLPKQDYDYMQDANNDRIPGWIRTLKLDEE